MDKFFFENDPLDELNQMPLSKKLYPFRKLVKNVKRKIVVKIEFTPLSLDRKIFPFKKGFKKREKKLLVFYSNKENFVICNDQYEYAVRQVRVTANKARAQLLN